MHQFLAFFVLIVGNLMTINFCSIDKKNHKTTHFLIFWQKFLQISSEAYSQIIARPKKDFVSDKRSSLAPAAKLKKFDVIRKSFEVSAINAEADIRPHRNNHQQARGSRCMTNLTASPAPRHSAVWQLAE